MRHVWRPLSSAFSQRKRSSGRFVASAVLASIERASHSFRSKRSRRRGHSALKADGHGRPSSGGTPDRPISRRGAAPAGAPHVATRMIQRTYPSVAMDDSGALSGCLAAQEAVTRQCSTTQTYFPEKKAPRFPVGRLRNQMRRLCLRTRSSASFPPMPIGAACWYHPAAELLLHSRSLPGPTSC